MGGSFVRGSREAPQEYSTPPIPGAGLVEGHRALPGTAAHGAHERSTVAGAPCLPVSAMVLLRSAPAGRSHLQGRLRPPGRLRPLTMAVAAGRWPRLRVAA